MQDNLKGILKQYYSKSFEDPVKKFKLKQTLSVLRKFILRIWESYSKQDFVSWFEREGKEHDERLEIKIAEEAVVS